MHNLIRRAEKRTEQFINIGLITNKKNSWLTPLRLSCIASLLYEIWLKKFKNNFEKTTIRVDIVVLKRFGLERLRL